MKLLINYIFPAQPIQCKSELEMTILVTSFTFIFTIHEIHLCLESSITKILNKTQTLGNQFISSLLVSGLDP